LILFKAKVLQEISQQFPAGIIGQLDNVGVKVGVLVIVGVKVGILVRVGVSVGVGIGGMNYL
jgi:hypothetical protein